MFYQGPITEIYIADNPDKKFCIFLFYIFILPTTLAWEPSVAQIYSRLVRQQFYFFFENSVYPNLPAEGCQQSFLSLLRERALCALYLYRSLDSKDFCLHNWVEIVTNPKQDIVIKRWDSMLSGLFFL